MDKDYKLAEHLIKHLQQDDVLAPMVCPTAVADTRLDVYKRQPWTRLSHYPPLHDPCTAQIQPNPTHEQLPRQIHLSLIHI